MHEVSLNVGPSEISDAVRQDIQEINESGLLAESHRGPVVQDLLRRAVAAIRHAASFRPSGSPSTTSSPLSPMVSTLPSHDFDPAGESS